MTLSRPMFPPVDPTRRRFLTVAAVGSMVSTGALATAALTPNDVPQAVTVPTASPAAAEPDPVFAAIERYKVLSAEYTVAVDRRAPLEDDDPDLSEAEDEASRIATALFEQMDLIFTFRPSTVAGVAALLKFISTLEDWQMAPGLEDGDGMKAAQTLCTGLAAAIEQSGVRA